MTRPKRNNISINEETSTGEPHLDIIAAIIRCAIEDYKRMKRKGKDTYHGLDAEKFILSDYFAYLTNGSIDGKKLLDKIDEEIEYERRKKHRDERNVVCRSADTDIHRS